MTKKPTRDVQLQRARHYAGELLEQLSLINHLLEQGSASATRAAHAAMEHRSRPRVRESVINNMRRMRRALEACQQARGRKG